MMYDIHEVPQLHALLGDVLFQEMWQNERKGKWRKIEQNERRIFF